MVFVSRAWDTGLRTQGHGVGGKIQGGLLDMVGFGCAGLLSEGPGAAGMALLTLYETPYKRSPLRFTWIDLDVTCSARHVACCGPWTHLGRPPWASPRWPSKEQSFKRATADNAGPVLMPADCRFERPEMPSALATLATFPGPFYFRAQSQWTRKCVQLCRS